MNARNATFVIFMLCVSESSATRADDDAIVPDRVIRLSDSEDLRGFYAFHKGAGRSDKQTVYSVVDGTIRISGQGRGYLATERRYKNYHLSVEFKWGQRTDGSGYVRNSGILLHKVNQDRVWPTSIEVQLAQGCEGDIIVIPGRRAAGKPAGATVTCETRIAEDGRTRWQRGGTKTSYSGRQFWWSKHQVGFAEKLDTRGREDIASPLGEWTKVECICDEDRISVRVNGVTVNECFDVYPSEGQILLQNEGNEVYFRNLDLRPLNKD